MLGQYTTFCLYLNARHTICSIILMLHEFVHQNNIVKVTE